MVRRGFATISVLLATLLGSATAWAQGTVVVAVPAKAGAVVGTTENSDAFIWRLFTEFAAPASKASPSPVVFETWASDDDTFSANPHWPRAGEPLKLHASVLAVMKTLNTGQSLTDLRAKAIDVACVAPQGAAVGGFPTSGTPSPCIAEQVARNRPQYDYIVNHHLNTRAGLKAAYEKSFDVDMPTASIAIKGDWIPVQTLLQWIPRLGDVSAIKKLY
jgi:hypothetical protein